MNSQRKQSRRAFRLESLETRTALSGVGALHTAAVVHSKDLPDHHKEVKTAEKTETHTAEKTETQSTDKTEVETKDVNDSPSTDKS